MGEKFGVNLARARWHPTSPKLYTPTNPPTHPPLPISEVWALARPASPPAGVRAVQTTQRFDNTKPLNDRRELPVGNELALLQNGARSEGLPPRWALVSKHEAMLAYDPGTIKSPLNAWPLHNQPKRLTADQDDADRGGRL